MLRLKHLGESVLRTGLICDALRAGLRPVARCTRLRAQRPCRAMRVGAPEGELSRRDKRGHPGVSPKGKALVYISLAYLQKTFDRTEKMCYHIVVQGCDEDTPRWKTPREEPFWCNGSVIGTRLDTTSEPPGGNAGTGTPVTASMSDGLGRNQGGTVEYFCIPPLFRQGMGYFLYPPPQFRYKI